MSKCHLMGQPKESIRLADSAQPHVLADRQNYNGPATRSRNTFNPSVICIDHTAPRRPIPAVTATPTNR
jgi:hypothetical protein